MTAPLPPPEPARIIQRPSPDCWPVQLLPEMLQVVVGFLGPYAARRLAASSRDLHSAYTNARWHTVTFLSAVAPRPSTEQIIQLLHPGQLEHSLMVLRLRLVTAGCRCWNGAELRSLRTLKRLQILEIQQAGNRYGLDDETAVALSEIPSLLSVTLLTCFNLTGRAANAFLTHPRLADLRITGLEGMHENPPDVEALFCLPRQIDKHQDASAAQTIAHAMIGTCPSSEHLRFGARFDERSPTPPALLLHPPVLATCVQATAPIISRLCSCKRLQHVALLVPGSIVVWALRELLGTCLPLRTLKLVSYAGTVRHARADCMNALSPPPPTLRGLELIIHSEQTFPAFAVNGHLSRDGDALEGFLTQLPDASGSERDMCRFFIDGLHLSGACVRQLRERWPGLRLRPMDRNSGHPQYEAIGHMACRAWTLM